MSSFKNCRNVVSLDLVLTFTYTVNEKTRVFDQELTCALLLKRRFVRITYLYNK